jgi:biotin carboxyl carrier protein
MKRILIDGEVVGIDGEVVGIDGEVVGIDGEVTGIDGEAVGPVPHNTLVEVEPGVYSILADGASHEVRVDAGQVTVGNRRFDYQIDDPRQWKRSDGTAGGQGRAAILAPMPGKVVRILVAVGDNVEAGQGIIVVEAMKMQNEMKAPRAGRVAAIQVKENDSVVAGAVLAVIEPAPTTDPAR